MTTLPASPAARALSVSTRRSETLMFLALTVLVWPVIAVGAVGAYGFTIWMSQLLFHTPLGH